MSLGTPVAADIPHLFDVIIDGKGYVFLRTIDTSLPFRTQRALYARTKTFADRQNVSNAYGDNAQAFYLTARQRNWSLGEQQKFFTPDRDGAYWRGQNVDVSIPAQVSLALDKVAVTFSETVEGVAKQLDQSTWVVGSNLHLYQVTDAGVVTDLGVHGLGGGSNCRPSFRAFTNDETKVYFSNDFSPSVGVRTWNGTVFATFSATTADSLTYLNNSLYGYRTATGSLVVYDTAGVASTLFTWKAADGTTSIINRCHLVPWGGKLLIGFHRSRPNAADLWIYDGTGVSRLEVFPENFNLADIFVLYGVVYIAGSFMRMVSGAAHLKPAIMFYDGGTLGKLWQADDFNTTAITDSAEPDAGPHPAMAVWDGKLVFTDESTGRLMAYDPAVGGVSCLSTFTPNVGGRVAMASAFTKLFQSRKDTSGFAYPAETYASSGYVASSLIDFESSLVKRFRSVRVLFDAGSDGNGGSVDIAYQVDSLTGSYTTLQSGAVSDTEYTFPTLTGHSVSIKVTLNRGTSTSGPVLKSVSLQAVPILTSFRECEYIMDLSGVDGQTPVILNDNETAHPKDGLSQAQDLAAVISSTNTFTFIDRFGTYTGIIEPDKSELIEVSPEEYIARIHARQI